MSKCSGWKMMLLDLCSSAGFANWFLAFFAFGFSSKLGFGYSQFEMHKYIEKKHFASLEERYHISKFK